MSLCRPFEGIYFTKSHVWSCRTILLTVLYEGLLIGFWFIDHALALRFDLVGPYFSDYVLQAGITVVLSVGGRDEVCECKIARLVRS